MKKEKTVEFKEGTFTCPKCGHANPEYAKFCAHCGTSLTLRCPTCGNQYNIGDRYCINCGKKLK